MLLDLREAMRIDERADRDAGLGALSHLERADLLGNLRREGVVNRILHVDAIRADARLPGVAVLGCERALRSSVEVGIVEDDERRIAAQLERELLDGVGALAH